MKTLGYIDRVGGAPRVYLPTARCTRWERFRAALRDIRGLGNVHLVVVRGHKMRIVATRNLSEGGYAH